MNQQTIILNQAVNFSGTVCRGITGTLCAEYPIVIKDLIGRILIQKSDFNSEKRIDINELRSGLYIIELKTKTSMHVFRFVKN